LNNILWYKIEIIGNSIIINIHIDIMSLINNLFSPPQASIFDAAENIKSITTKGPIVLTEINQKLADTYSKCTTPEGIEQNIELLPYGSEIIALNNKIYSGKSPVSSNINVFRNLLNFKHLESLFNTDIFNVLSNYTSNLNDIKSKFDMIAGCDFFLYLLSSNFPVYVIDFMEYVAESDNTLVHPENWLMLFISFEHQIFLENNEFYDETMARLDTVVDKIFQYLPVIVIQYWMKQYMTSESQYIVSKYGKAYLDIMSHKDKQQCITEYPQLFKPIIEEMIYECSTIEEYLKYQKIGPLDEFIVENISKFGTENLEILLGSNIELFTISAIRTEFLKRNIDITKYWRLLSTQTKLEICSQYYQIEDDDQVIVYCCIDTDYHSSNINRVSGDDFDNNYNSGNIVQFRYGIISMDSHNKSATHSGCKIIPSYLAIHNIELGYTVAECMVHIDDIILPLYDKRNGYGVALKFEILGFPFLSEIITNYNNIHNLSTIYKIVDLTVIGTSSACINAHSNRSIPLPSLDLEIIRLNSSKIASGEIENMMNQTINMDTNYNKTDLIKILVSYMISFSDNNINIKLTAFIGYSNALMENGKFMLDYPEHLQIYLRKLHELSAYFPQINHYHNLIYLYYPQYINDNSTYRTYKLASILGLATDDLKPYAETEQMSDDDAALSSDDNFEVTDEEDNELSNNMLRELANDITNLKMCASIASKLVILKNICNKYMTKGCIYHKYNSISMYIYKLLKENQETAPYASNYIKIIDEYIGSHEEKVKHKIIPKPLDIAKQDSCMIDLMCAEPPRAPTELKEFTFNGSDIDDIDDIDTIDDIDDIDTIDTIDTIDNNINSYKELSLDSVIDFIMNSDTDSIDFPILPSHKLEEKKDYTSMVNMIEEQLGLTEQKQPIKPKKKFKKYKGGWKK